MAVVCQAATTEGPPQGGPFCWSRGGGSGAGARRAVRLICADPGAAGPGFVSERPPSRIGRGRRCGLLIAESRMLSREGRCPPPPRANVSAVAGRQSTVATAQQKPASSRATATAIDRAALAALASSRCQMRCRRRWACQEIAITCGGLAVLAARELAPDPGRPAVVPGGLDQQPAGVPAAGLGDRALPAPLAGGVLGRAPGRGSSSAARRARSARSRRSRRTARPRSACRCRAGSAAGATSLRPRRVGHQRGDLALELVAADQQRVDRAAIVQQRRLRGRLGRARRRQPAAVALGPVRLPSKRTSWRSSSLREPVPGAHQIAADVLARADQIAQRLLVRRPGPGPGAARRPSATAPAARRRGGRS